MLLLLARPKEGCSGLLLVMPSVPAIQQTASPVGPSTALTLDRASIPMDLKGGPGLTGHNRLYNLIPRGCSFA